MTTMRRMPIAPMCAGGLLLLCTNLVSGQSLQNSGLIFLQTIPVPNWRVGTANTDVFGFNPVTQTMYLADRTNHGIDVINSRDNGFLGTIPLASNSVPNVPLVVIDRQELVVSDGLSSVFVYNLR